MCKSAHRAQTLPSPLPSEPRIPQAGIRIWLLYPPHDKLKDFVVIRRSIPLTVTALLDSLLPAGRLSGGNFTRAASESLGAR